MKYDILIKDTDGKPVAEFIVSKETLDTVLIVLREDAELGGGHEVPLENIQ